MIKNIRDAQTFDKNHMKKETLFQQDDHSIFLINLLPGQKLPAHRHPDQHVYLLVLEGEGEYTINGERHSLAWRDVLHGQNDEWLGVENTGRKFMTLYVVLTRNCHNQVH
ncbi:MAG TPA: cupin domain-containing protein [Bacillales bacterium]|nr:cupin domain-containing protein [Bacillales bacterium]